LLGKLRLSRVALARALLSDPYQQTATNHAQQTILRATKNKHMKLAQYAIEPVSSYRHTLVFRIVHFATFGVFYFEGAHRIDEMLFENSARAQLAG
jgi:hypothetical protein